MNLNNNGKTYCCSFLALTSKQSTHLHQKRIVKSLAFNTHQTKPNLWKLNNHIYCFLYLLTNMNVVTKSVSFINKAVVVDN